MAEIALRIADKVRNPAIAIGGLVRRLGKEKPGTDSYRKKLALIQRETLKLEEIVKKFERLAAHQSFFVHGSLAEAVEDAVAALESLFAKKGIKVRLDTTSTPLKVRMNPSTIKAALIHILRNAGEASPENSDILIKIGRKQGNPFVMVTDKGPGIPPQVREKIFKDVVTTKPSGTGMGLLLVKQIMQEHQGRVEIKSQEGKGSSLTLIFPVRWKE